MLVWSLRAEGDVRGALVEPDGRSVTRGRASAVGGRVDIRPLFMLM